MDIQPIESSTYVNDNIELLNLITGYNKQTLTEEEKDKLDELITKNDTNMYLFEIFTDKKLRKQLRKTIKSMKKLD